MPVACDDWQRRASWVKWGEAIQRIIKFASIMLLPSPCPPIPTSQKRKKTPDRLNKLEFVSLPVVMWGAWVQVRQVWLEKMAGIRSLKEPVGVWTPVPGVGLRCRCKSARNWLVVAFETLERHRVVKAVCRREPRPLAVGGSFGGVLLCRWYGKVPRFHNYSVIFFTFTALVILKYKHVVTEKK